MRLWEFLVLCALVLTLTGTLLYGSNEWARAAACHEEEEPMFHKLNADDWFMVVVASVMVFVLGVAFFSMYRSASFQADVWDECMATRNDRVACYEAMYGDR